MKNVYTIFFVGWALSVHSQPTLTSANETAIGNSFTFVFVDTTGIQPGSSGAMQTWDFSSIAPTGITQAEDWVSPAQTPFEASYPNANIVQQVDNGSGTLSYLYHNLTGTETRLEGIATDLGGFSAIMIYSNTEIIREYPATFNSTLNDTYSGVATVTIGPITTNTYRNGTYEYLVDGYGLLVTPVASYPNTLRIKLRQVFTDSTVYTGSPLPTTVLSNFSTTYFWASTDAGDKLYQFYIGYDTTITDTTTEAFISSSYQDETTGLESSSSAFSLKYINAYPNPSSKTTTITIDRPVDGIAELVLYDLKGRVVKNMEARMTKANRFEWTFDVDNLEAGLYMCKVSCSGNLWMSKILKQ